MSGGFVQGKYERGQAGSKGKSSGYGGLLVIPKWTIRGCETFLKTKDG